MKLPEIYKEDNCLYLTQDLSGMGVYDKAKAIVSFCDKETKLFEKEIDRAIAEIFEKNKVNLPNTDKKVLKLAFDLLKSRGKTIEIVDLFKYDEEKEKDDSFTLVKKTKNKFTVMLETFRVNGCYSEVLQCGVQVVERSLGKVLL